MVIELPIIGSLALGTGTVLERLVLKNKKIGIKLYQVVSFLAIVLALIPFLFFFWKINSGAFELKNILIFVGVIICSIFANLLIFYSEKWEKITNLEPAKLLEPLFVILLTLGLGFLIADWDNESPKVIIPAIIAALALIFSHVRKHHLQFNKYFIATIFGSLFFALELVLSSFILEFYSSITFYFLRCLSVLIISLAIFRPKFKALDKKTSGIILLTGIIWVVYRMMIYFGYLHYGIIFTTLMIMLGPIVVYILANRLLKEKLNWKNIVSSIIIIACVLYATLS